MKGAFFAAPFPSLLSYTITVILPSWYCSRVSILYALFLPKTYFQSCFHTKKKSQWEKYFSNIFKEKTNHILSGKLVLLKFDGTIGLATEIAQYIYNVFQSSIRLD